MLTESVQGLCGIEVLTTAVSPEIFNLLSIKHVRIIAYSTCRERAWGIRSCYSLTMTVQYETEIKDIVRRFDPEQKNRYFLFGSSVRKEEFRDIDMGVIGNTQAQKKLTDLREQFYQSRIPYSVDVVDFDTADSHFREYVLRTEPIVWMN